MAEFPKHFAKGDRKRIAHNVRDQVKLEFEGYRVAKPEAEAPAEKSIEEREGTKAAPQLPLEELVKHPEANGAEVVDVTNDPKPSAPKRGN